MTCSGQKVKPQEDLKVYWAFWKTKWRRQGLQVESTQAKTQKWHAAYLGNPGGSETAMLLKEEILTALHENVGIMTMFNEANILKWNDIEPWIRQWSCSPRSQVPERIPSKSVFICACQTSWCLMGDIINLTQFMREYKLLKGWKTCRFLCQGSHYGCNCAGTGRCY